MTEIYNGKRLRIVKEMYRFPSGKEKERIVVHPGDAVAMLPIEKGECVLIRQFRFAIDDNIIEAPAGMIDPGETPLEAARRELIEEIGMSGSEFIPRGFIYTTPGFSTEKIHLYEVRGLMPSRDYVKDEDEEMTIVKIPADRVLEMALYGEIYDAKTVALACRCLR